MEKCIDYASEQNNLVENFFSHHREKVREKGTGKSSQQRGRHNTGIIPLPACGM
jgi:hypothetical protein